MQILRDPPLWNADAAGLLKDFLESTVGQVFLANLAASRPDFFPNADLNATALRACEIAGYEKCVSALLRLTEAPKEPVQTESNSYPSIDDEEKWNTGEEKE